jgi:hypothetical protein
VFQFAQADIIDADTFDLTLRLRGQAGTDGVTPAEWPKGSIFVLLNGVPEQIELASSARGVAQHFRCGPGTRPLGDASYQYRTDAFSGIGLRPYSVAHLRGILRNGDVDLTWIRRARVGGDNWDTEDAPLSEAFERYVVRVFKDDIQVRQLAVSDPRWTYTAALQATDGPGATRIDVAQMSETFGEGPSSGLVLAT